MEDRKIMGWALKELGLDRENAIEMIIEEEKTKGIKNEKRTN